MTCNIVTQAYCLSPFLRCLHCSRNPTSRRSFSASLCISHTSGSILKARTTALFLWLSMQAQTRLLWLVLCQRQSHPGVHHVAVRHSRMNFLQLVQR